MSDNGWITSGKLPVNGIFSGIPLVNYQFANLNMADIVYLPKIMDLSIVFL